jgi:hypothetical protein
VTRTGLLNNYVSETKCDYLINLLPCRLRDPPSWVTTECRSPDPKGTNSSICDDRLLLSLSLYDHIPHPPYSNYKRSNSFQYEPRKPSPSSETSALVHLSPGETDTSSSRITPYLPQLHLTSSQLIPQSYPHRSTHPHGVK